MQSTGEEAEGTQNVQPLTFSPGGLPAPLMRKLLEDHLVPQLDRITEYVSHLEWRVYGSSLLIVYEGDQEVLERTFEEDCTGEATTVCAVKMIDFAHAWEAQDPDLGLLTGLETTSRMFKTILTSISELSASDRL